MNCRILEPGETVESLDFYKREGDSDAFYIPVGNCRYCGTKVGEAQHVIFSRPVRDAKPVIILDVPEFPQEIIDAERLLTGFFHVTGNGEWEFRDIACRALVYKLKEENRRFEIMVRMRENGKKTMQAEIDVLTRDLVRVGQQLYRAQKQLEADDGDNGFPGWLCFLMGILCAGAAGIIVSTLTA